MTPIMEPVMSKLQTYIPVKRVDGKAIMGRCDDTFEPDECYHKKADVDAQWEELVEDVESWQKAYPLDVFPEPDFKKARELLEAGGMTIDAISASNMRHVLKRMDEKIKAIREVE